MKTHTGCTRIENCTRGRAVISNNLRTYRVCTSGTNKLPIILSSMPSISRNDTHTIAMKPVIALIAANHEVSSWWHRQNRDGSLQPDISDETAS